MNPRSICALLIIALFVPSFSYGTYRMDESGTVDNSAPKKAKPSSSSIKNTKKIQFHGKTDAPSIEQDVLEDLSKRYSVPVDRLQYFRNLRYGYEEIVPSLVVAREAQVEAGRVLKSRMEGKTWSAIAESYSIDLKPLNQEVLQVLAPIRKSLPKQALIEKPSNMQ